MAQPDAAALIEQARQFLGAPAGNRRVGRDPVNQAMINHWVQAFEDDNPVYVDPELAERTRHDGLVAPPAMMQTWVMDAPEEPDGPRGEVLRRIDEAGYTSVVATNYQHEYLRELRLGERVTQQTSVEDLSDEKATALGTGRFVTMKHEYLDDAGEVVAIGRMRLLKFRPPSPNGSSSSEETADRDGATTEDEDAPKRARPAITRDNAFFWEGVDEGELRIQQCGGCGTLRHPPRPMCDQCQSTDWTWVVSSGRGRIHSHVVHHHPPLPGVETPHAVVLVDLEEGTRMVSHMVQGTDPSRLAIGRPVELEFEAVDEELVLPLFRLVEEDA